MPVSCQVLVMLERAFVYASSCEMARIVFCSFNLCFALHEHGDEHGASITCFEEKLLLLNGDASMVNYVERLWICD